MKRIIICALLVFLATGVVVGWLMLSDYWQRAGEEKLITDVICIFSEGNYRGTRYTFVFSDWEIFVQVKGSKDRKWYESKLEALPEPLMMRYPYWATTREGQILPPFPPHYPPFVRVCMPRDRTKPEKIIYFDSSDLEMWFLGLRGALVIRENRTDKLPPWVEEDGRIKKHLHLP